MVSGMGFVKLMRVGLMLLVAGSAAGQDAAQQTYFEFGTVFSIGSGRVDLRVYDQAKHTLVQHSFLLSRDTRADVVRVGEVVEVIYTSDAGRLTAQRLVATGGTVPKAGGPPPAPSAPARTTAPVVAGKTVPKTGTVGLPAVPKPVASAAVSTSGVTLGKTMQGKVPGTVSVGLGDTKEGKVPNANSVALGGGTGATPKLLQPKTIEHDTPAEECHRSDAGWAAQPIRVGVMDFRYPTDKEDAADMTEKGGGSGTLVADLVFDRLGQDPTFAVARGDRDKLYRGDFAGAARLGRQMGVDAVLAGTFNPVPQQKDADGFDEGPKYYELKAGLVDTCTGQLLERLVSVTCADGSVPDVGGPSTTGCTRYKISAKQASDPREAAASFKPAMDALLSPMLVPGPLEANGAKVIAVNGGALTIAVGTMQVKVGDTIAVHATRLAKNVTTDTLRNLHDEEIGRMVVTAVQGGNAVGNFSGDYVAKVGDGAEVLVPQ